MTEIRKLKVWKTVRSGRILIVATHGKLSIHEALTPGEAMQLGRTLIDMAWKRRAEFEEWEAREEEIHRLDGPGTNLL